MVSFLFSYLYILGTETVLFFLRELLVVKGRTYFKFYGGCVTVMIA